VLFLTIYLFVCILFDDVSFDHTKGSQRRIEQKSSYLFYSMTVYMRTNSAGEGKRPLPLRD
jgi:hypothetical protein